MSSNGGRNVSRIIHVPGQIRTNQIRPWWRKAASRAKSVSTNAKVFRDLTSKLSSNIQEDYIDAAKKLTAWLGSEKAYYMEARPQVRRTFDMTLQHAHIGVFNQTDSYNARGGLSPEISLSQFLKPLL